MIVTSWHYWCFTCCRRSLWLCLILSSWSNLVSQQQHLEVDAKFSEKLQILPQYHENKNYVCSWTDMGNTNMSFSLEQRPLDIIMFSHDIKAYCFSCKEQNVGIQPYKRAWDTTKASGYFVLQAVNLFFQHGEKYTFYKQNKMI